MEKLTRPWSARTLRLTAFLRSDNPIEAISPDAWGRATGQTPAIDQSQPRQLSRVHGGPIGPGFLMLQIQGLARRVDWIMEPAPDDPSGGVPPLELGPVETALAAFNEVVRGWLATTDIVANRLAVGTIAVMPEPDRITAYKALQDFLPSVKIDPERSRDFQYRINRPKLSRVLGPDVELNRITTWNALRLRLLSPSGPVSAFGGEFAAVECDHSTPAEREEPLENARFVDIYDELVEMALQNLERGELP
jgi:hypothetical protein